MTMRLLDRLAAGEVVVLDGGMGSQLIARGLEGGERWNLERPDVVRAIHADYREAGARALLTNTFGANRIALGRHRMADRIEALNRAAVALAREAAGDGVWVAGNIGPTGEFLEPLGEATPEQMRQVFAEQARLLADAGVDFFLIETMTDLGEITCAVEACREAASIPVAASMSFDPAGGGYRTMMGKTPEECARALEAAGADIIGTNCGTVSPSQMAEVVARLRSATGKPLLCEANAGAPQMVGGQVAYAQGLQEWLEGMQACRAAGAQLLGGCCGTTPAHIRALAEWVRTTG